MSIRRSPERGEAEAKHRGLLNNQNAPLFSTQRRDRAGIGSLVALQTFSDAVGFLWKLLDCELRLRLLLAKNKNEI
jgi:hypothetical protein